MRAEETAG